MPAEAPSVLRILIAPDSFKGTINAADAGTRIAAGWRAARPDDAVVVIPMADGGEGTLDVLVAAHPGASLRCLNVCGPDGRRTEAAWALLADGTAVVELARASGLPMMAHLDPLGATTFGLGELLAAACKDPSVTRIVVSLGGSATTDGGAGALQALGARLGAEDHSALPHGGGALADLFHVDLSGLLPPPDGVICLVDVTAPLLGPLGAAAQFGPQKGASPDDIDLLERGLARWAGLLGGSPGTPGTGAAGGTAYGLVTAWRAELASGADTVGELSGFHSALPHADLVLTGEGRFDSQSMRGKVVGHVIERAVAGGVPVGIIAGRGDAAAVPTGISLIQLAELAGSDTAAMGDAGHWLEVAGHTAAVDFAADLEEAAHA